MQKKVNGAIQVSRFQHRQPQEKIKFLDFSISIDCGVYFHKAPINSKKPGSCCRCLLEFTHIVIMKTLGALPSFFLTSIRKDFVRQITDVYYTKYQCRAPKPFCKISSLSFLPHLLQIPVDWKSISVKLFLAKFAVQCDINPSDTDTSHLYDYWQIAKNSPQFYQFCDQLFTYRIQVRQNLLVSLKKITTWNISGWRPPTQGCDFKMSIIRRHLKKGPVCLQETRWSTSMTVGMQQRFNAVQICSSEAIPTINGGSSGGVAVLVPTSLQVLDTTIIVPGRALAVKVSSRTAKFWIFSVYLHPTSKKKELQDICKWILNGNIPEVPSVVSGDFNHVDSEHPDELTPFCLFLELNLQFMVKLPLLDPEGNPLLMMYWFQLNICKIVHCGRKSTSNVITSTQDMLRLVWS